MTRSPLTRALAAALLALAIQPPCAAGAASRNTIETEDLRLLYVDPVQTLLAPYTARCFENSMLFQRALWDYEPSEPVSVLLSDFSDQGNAAAGYVPRNTLLVELSPLSYSYETVSANEHMNWIMNHELVHIATADRAAGSDRFFRTLFQGKVAANADDPESILYFYLTTPRHAAPRWFREGLAVFIETWMAGGMGRALGAWDEMVFRAMVRDGTRFYDPLGLASEGERDDFQAGANAYLYGTRFLSYLAYRYSPEHLVRWASRTPGTRKYYAAQFREVFGIPLKQAWREWVAFEQEFQQANLNAIREYPLTPYEDLSERALGSVSRAYFDRDEGQLYAAVNYPGVVPHIAALSVDDRSVERLVDVKGALIYDVTSLTYDPESKTIYYTTDNHEYRNLMALDPATKKSRMLLEEARIGDLAFNRADRSIWGVRHFNGIASLVRVPYPHEEWNRVRSWPFGEVIYNLDVSPDGKLLSASVGEINGRHTLRVYEIESLLAGEAQAVREVEFATAMPANFVFSEDGRYLWGSSYYTGVSNIFRYEIATDDLRAMTNTDSGFFRPIPLDDGSLYIFRYTGEGFVPARVEVEPLEDINAITFLGQQVIETHPELREWVVGSPASVPLDELIRDRGEYRSFKQIGLESVYPVIEGYKDSWALGGRVNFSDPISVNQLSVTGSYSPDNDLPSDERLHLSVKFKRYNWTARLRYNGADFYDLFGPTKTSRKGYMASVSHKKTLLYDSPRKTELEIFGSWYADIDQLPRYQNVETAVDRLLEAGVLLTHENMRSSLGAVDNEKGLRWDVYAGAQYVDGDTIPSMAGTLDLGFALPLPNSSIWWRNAGGIASGNLDDPFANFFFGGFGNNYVDYRSIQRYREWFAFPGLELNEIGGRNFLKSMVEWNLPPLRFERVGSPGFYLTWARASLFAAAIETNFGEDSDPGQRVNGDLLGLRRRVADVGAQVDFRLTLLHRLKLTLSLGYAMAIESGEDSRDEFMFSLKIL